MMKNIRLATIGCSLLSFSLSAATYTVTSKEDTSTPGTLRYGLANAVTQNIDDIEFDPTIAGSTIKLTSPLPAITNPMTIDGGSQKITIDGLNGANRYPAFTVESTTTSISNLTIINTRAQGGTGGAGGEAGGTGGSGGGGGGLGAGGAVFVDEAAQVILTKITFIDNSAYGGVGGSGDNVTGQSGGGGGGGLTGSGSSAGNTVADGGGGGGFPGSATTSTGVDGGGNGALAGTSMIAVSGQDFGGGGAGAGGATVTTRTVVPGAAGGFGGGGGGGGSAAQSTVAVTVADATGGVGGFGGGGGGGGTPKGSGTAHGGQGSFAGTGGTGPGANGGGGSGLGGSVFGRFGSNITLVDCTITSAVPNVAGTGANIGLAEGDAMYLMSGVTANITANAGSTISASIAGEGGIYKDGPGPLNLTGAVNSYIGGTIVNDGTLLGDVDSLQGTIVNDGTLVFNQLSADGVFSGNISGTGILRVINVGGMTPTSLTLPNADSFTGSTDVQIGRLILGNADSISSSTSVKVERAGALVLEALPSGGTLIATVNELQTNGSVVLNDNTLIMVNETNTTLEGPIFGTPGSGASGTLVKQGAGTTTFLGSNTYQNLDIEEGAVRGYARTIPPGSIVGDILLNGNDTSLIFDQHYDDAFTGNITQTPLVGNGNVVKMGAGVLNLTGVNSYTGTDIQEGIVTVTQDSFQGGFSLDTADTVLVYIGDASTTYPALRPSFSPDTSIDGLGTFEINTQDPAVIVTLTDLNTFTGPTVIASGTLQLNSPIALIASGSVNVSPGAFLNVNVSDGTIVNQLQGSGGINLLNASPLTINIDTADTTIAGLIFESDGVGGSIIKEGAYNTTLLGANTYTGGTIINAGGILGTTVAIHGDYLFNGFGTSLTFIDNGAPTTYSNKITESVEAGSNVRGTVYKTGDNQLTLSPTVPYTYSGGTIVTGGNLVLNSYSMQGAISIDSSNTGLIFNGTLTAPLTGANPVTLSGSGTFTVLNATNGLTLAHPSPTFTGPTVLEAGELALSDPDALSGSSSVLINGGASIIAVAPATLHNVSGASDLVNTPNIYIGDGATTTLTLIYDNPNGADTVIAGPIVDGLNAGSVGALVKTGPNKLILLGDNSYTGGTTILQGALQGHGSGSPASITGDMTIASGAVLIFDQSLDSGTYSGGMITGDGAVQKIGAADLTMTPNGLGNTYTGGTEIVNGRLFVDDLSMRGDFILDTPATFLIFDDSTAAGPYDYGTFLPSFASEQIIGYGNFVKEGTTQLNLVGPNIYSGTTEIATGILSLQDVNAISNSMSVTIDDTLTATLDVGTGTLVNPVVINELRADGGKITLNANALEMINYTDTTINALISGTGTLIKAGTGTTTLGGLNTYSNTQINSGGIQGTTDSLVGNYVFNGPNTTLTFNQAFLGSFGGNITQGPSGNGVVVKTGSGELSLSGTNSYSGTDVQDGGLLVDQNSFQGNISLDTDTTFLVYQGTANATYPPAATVGIIDGYGAFQMESPGNTVTFSGLNTYTGETLITDGTLSLDYALAVVGSSAVIVQTDGILDVAVDAVVKQLQGNGQIHLNANQLTISIDTADTTISGPISGSGGSLVKEGSYNTTLLGPNSYSNGTTINEGGILGITSAIVGNYTFNGYGTSLTFIDNGAPTTYSSTITETGAVRGIVYKTGDNQLSLLPPTTNNYSGGTVVTGGNLLLNQYSMQGAISIDGVDTGLTYAGSGAAPVGLNPLSLSGNGTFMAAGSGVLTLADASPTFIGPTHVVSGVLNLSDAESLSGSAMVLIHAGATIHASADTTLHNVAGAADGIGTPNLVIGGASPATLTLIYDNPNGADTVIAGPIVNGASRGALIKAGPNKLILLGENSYTGGTTILQGALQGHAASSPASITGDMTINNGAVLIFDQSLASGTYSGGVITGEGAVQKIGAADLTMLPIGLGNTYTGGTEVVAGRLFVNDLSMRGDFILDTPATFLLFNDSTNVTHNYGVFNPSFASEQIIGLGNFVKEGTTQLNLIGPNTYSGTTEIATGILSLKDPNAISNSVSVTIDNDPTAQLDIGVTGPVVVHELRADGGLITLNANTLEMINFTDTTINAAISGTGTLMKAGTGTTTLGGANTYSTTHIHSGAIQGNTNAIVGNYIFHGTNTTLTFTQDSFDGTYVGNITETTGVHGKVVKTGGNQLSLLPTTLNTYSGGTDIQAGSFVTNGYGWQGAFTLDTPSTYLVFTGSINAPVASSNPFTLAGIGTLNVAGNTGTNLTLSNANFSFTGPTVISGGTLTLNNLNAINESISVTMEAAGILALTTDAIVRNLQGEGNIPGGNISLGANQLTMINSVDTTIGALINGTGGSIVKQGAGTTTLLGLNIYSGGTEIFEGAIQGFANLPAGTGSIQGDYSFTGNGSLIFNQTNTGTYTGTITDAASNIEGLVFKTGGGVTNLFGTAQNNYKGGTVIDQGTLFLNQYSMQGQINITNTDSFLGYNDSASIDYPNGNPNWTISGIGTFLKQGTGQLTLSAPNSFTGPTIISAGTLNLSDENAISSSSSVTLLTPGALTIDAALTGADGYAIVNNLQGTGQIIFNGPNGLDMVNTINTTISGPISGPGFLVKDGVGVTTLTGSNSYTGGTEIIAGGIMGSANLAGAGGPAPIFGDYILSSPATLTFYQTAPGNYNTGIITGPGSVIKCGGADLTLNPTTNNTYSGGTDIQSGTLIVGFGSMQGNFTLDTPATTLIYNDINTQNYGAANQMIDGTGAFVKKGLGNLTLNFPNTYTGPTTVAAGTLTLTSANVISSSISVLTQVGSTLATFGNVTVNRLSGAGNIVMGGSSVVTMINDIDGTISGAISGNSASLRKQGEGTTNLQGINSYSGATFIQAGAIQGYVTSAGTGSIFGDYYIDEGTALIFNQNTTSAIYNSGTLVAGFGGGGTGGKVIKTGWGDLIMNPVNPNTFNGGTEVQEGTLIVSQNALIGNFALDPGTELVYSDNPLQSSFNYGGQISGAGGFTLNSVNDSFLQFGSQNSYTGPTEIASGILILNDPNAISSSSSVDVAFNTVLGMGVSPTVQNLQGAGEIQLEGNTLTMINNLDTTIDGGIVGTGTVNKLGEGTTTLLGSNEYDLLQINAGSVIGFARTSTPGSIVGNVNVNGQSQQLIFNQPFNDTFDGDISGAGGVTKTGAGQLTLTGANSYSGGTDVQTGSLVVTNNSLQGNFSLDTANTSLIYNDAGATYTGMIDGLGSLVVQGNLNIGGVNTYTGATQITGSAALIVMTSSAISSSSSVDIGPSSTLGAATGNVFINNLSGAGTINLLNDTLTVTQTVPGLYQGTIIGPDATRGILVKQGISSLTLTGTSNAFGLTQINEGQLIGNSLSLQGAITISNNAQLVIDQSFTGDDTGIVSVGGIGEVVKQGVGNFTINNTWGNTGKTRVNQGILSVGPSGNLMNSSETIVAPGATIQGTGIVGNLTVYGIMHPGFSPGTFNVFGTYTLGVGSFFDVEITSGGAHSLVNVTGNAVIQDDATIRVTPDAGTYAVGQSYVVINTTTGVAGIFDDLIVNNPGSLDGATISVIYTPLQVILNIAPVHINPDNGGGVYLNAALAIQNSWLTDSIFQEQLDWHDQNQKGCQPKVQKRYTPFVMTNYQQGELIDTEDSLGGTYSDWALYAGVDTYIQDDFFIGVAGGFLQGHGHSGRVDIDSESQGLSLAIYAQKYWKCRKFTLDGYAAGIWSDYDTKRNDINRITGDTWGGTFIAKIRFLYEYINRGLHIKPLVALIGNYTLIDGYAETGSSPHVLNFGRTETGFLDGEVALQLFYPVTFENAVFIPEVKGGYMYDFIDSKAHVDAIMPAYGFTKTDLPVNYVNRQQGFVRAGFSLGSSEDTKIGVYYESVFGGNKTTSHGFLVAFKSAF